MTQSGLNAMNFATDGNGSLISSATSADSMTNTLQWGNAYQFKLGSAIDSGDFTTLYDKYKILMVKIKIMYQAESATSGGASVLPIFNYCTDYDDSVAPTSLNNVATKQRARSLVLSANKPITITLRPKVAVPVYQGVLTAYSVNKAPYVDCVYPDVLHYGLKTWINNFYTPTGANTKLQYNQLITYRFATLSNKPN